MEPFTEHSTWHQEIIGPNLIQAAEVKQTLYRGSTQYQEVVFLDTFPFGRTLVLDGKTQSSEMDEFVYHEALVQPSLVSHKSPERILIAGGGEGATAREVLRHSSVKNLTMIDLDSELVELCKEYLPLHHQGSFGDPRIKVISQDVMEFLENSRDQYDVIVIDLPDPLEGGPAYLCYTREFYTLVASRLSPGGIMVTQAGPTGPNNHKEVFTAILNTMGSVFKSTLPYRVYIPSFGTLWGFAIGSQADASAITSIDVDEVDSRINQRLNSDLKFYDGETHRGLFMLPKYLRSALYSESRIITTESPIFAT